MKTSLPFLIGLIIAIGLYLKIGWWGFFIIFPWIGFAITFGLFIVNKSPKHQKGIGRRTALLLILPILLLFTPVVNKENLQLEGVVLLLSVGFFSKGVIHYAIAKIFGPLFWGRGFCGWACWTAAILDWLPIRKPKEQISPKLKHIRYLALFASILLPLLLIFLFSYDVRNEYLNKNEMMWMFAGNIIYYLVAIPLAYYFNDKRAFCKIVCPVSLIMKCGTSFSLSTVKPSGVKCLQCKQCTNICPMDIDVMPYILNNKPVHNTECILCMECRYICPTGAIK